MNRLEILGRVEQDVKLTHAESGTAMLKVPVVDARKKGEKWISQVFVVVLYGQQAQDFAGLKAGTEVWALGEYEKYEWTNRQGKREKTEFLSASYFRITTRPSAEVTEAGAQPA